MAGGKKQQSSTADGEQWKGLLKRLCLWPYLKPVSCQWKWDCSRAGFGHRGGFCPLERNWKRALWKGAAWMWGLHLQAETQTRNFWTCGTCFFSISYWRLVTITAILLLCFVAWESLSIDFSATWHLLLKVWRNEVCVISPDLFQTGDSLFKEGKSVI